MSDCVTVYAVFADAAEAQRIGAAMVAEGLAACVNILPPCTSIYRWQGRTETAREVPALLKTTAAAAPALVRAIAAAHSHEVPALVVWPWADSLPAYAEWVRASCRAAADQPQG